MSAGPLNLADADLKGFDAIEAARYNAIIHEITMDAVKNTSGQGKMPAGTPMVKFQFRLTDEPNVNRAVWSQFIIPPKDYDKAKASKMKGMLARAFIALGEEESKVISKDFDPDFEEFKGRECVVVLGKEPKKDMNGEIVEGEFNNPVKGIKPAGTAAGATTGGLL